MTSPTVFSILASPQLLESLKAYESENILMTEPVNVDQSDDLHAPITPDELKAILELVKVGIQTIGATVTFATALVKLAKTWQEEITIKDANTGKEKGVIKPDTTPEEAEKMIKS